MNLRKTLDNLMGIREPILLDELLERGYVDMDVFVKQSNFILLGRGNIRMVYDKNKDQIIGSYRDDRDDRVDIEG